MGFLIARLGHEVVVVRRGEDPSEVSASLGAAVVVLDGSDSLAEMGEMVAAIERLLPEAQVLVVTDTAVAEDHRFRVVPKWSPFDRLGLEIEVAAKAVNRPVTAEQF
jgi:hypothetical protein